VTRKQQFDCFILPIAHSNGERRTLRIFLALCHKIRVSPISQQQFCYARRIVHDRQHKWCPAITGREVRIESFPD